MEVTNPAKTRGTAMKIIGLTMVLISVLIALLTEDPLPVAFAVVGIVFIGVGSRKERDNR